MAYTYLANSRVYRLATAQVTLLILINMIIMIKTGHKSISQMREKLRKNERRYRRTRVLHSEL